MEFKMLGISLCAIFSLSTWWEFSHRGYVIEKVEESKRKPLLALFTDSETSNADTLIAQFRNFSTTDPRVLNSTATHINCSNSQFCASLPQFPIPCVQIIRGPFPKYWHRTTDFNPLTWLELLNASIQALPAEIDSAAELHASIANSVHGGTTFHLVTSNRTRTALRLYRTAAQYYGIFGCAFTYSLRATGSSVLAGFRAEGVVIKTKIRPIQIEKFIERNRFSLFHNFDYDEFLIAIKERPIVLLLENITNPYLNVSLERFSELNFGTMEIETAPELRRFFGDEIPLVIGYNGRRDCLLQNTSISNAFLEDVAKARNCMAASVLGRHVRMEEPGRGSPALVFPVAVALGVIACAGFGHGKASRVKKVKVD
jgi:hypothetical protein